jgi:multidrug efflux pump subunit AcrA (membrane-fusion protein)
MRRREFIAGLGSTAACPLVARALGDRVAVPDLAWMSTPAKTQVLRGDQAATEPNSIVLTETQIGAAGITVEEARGGDLQGSLRVPGTIIPSADRIARIGVKLLGTVAEIRKRLGDTVQRGEVVAVIESRDVADAKSDYLAASRLRFATNADRARKTTRRHAGDG